MIDREINIAVANACGWDCDPEVARDWDSRGQWCIAPSMFQHKLPHKEGDLVSMNVFMPKYTTDLNACRKMEKFGIDNIEGFDALYWVKLAEITKCSRIDAKQSIHASAGQRVAAFIETVNILKS